MTRTAVFFLDRDLFLRFIDMWRVYMQALSWAVEKQTESEVHFKALAERESGRLRQEISQLQNEQLSLQEKKNSQEVKAFLFS